MNSFWQGFEKKALEKEAILMAGLAHIAQNEGMKKLLGHQPFGVSVGNHFTQGLLGLKERFGRLKALGRGLASGASLPETEVFRNHARDLGSHVREHLRQQGITSLPATALKKMQEVLQAGPEALHQSTDPYIVALRTGMANHPVFSKILHAREGLDQLTKSKEHPLLSNIAKNLVQPPQAGAAHYPLPHKVPLHQGYSAAGQLVGSTAAGLMDPATGAMNAFKTVTTNPAARKIVDRFAPAKKALDWVDRKLVKEPLQRAAEAGSQGKPLNRATTFMKTHLLNPVLASAENTANKFNMEVK